MKKVKSAVIIQHNHTTKAIIAQLQEDSTPKENNSIEDMGFHTSKATFVDDDGDSDEYVTDDYFNFNTSVNRKRSALKSNCIEINNLKSTIQIYSMTQPSTID